MFSSKDSKKETEVSKPRNDGKPQVPSIISANLKIVGNLVSDGDVQVDAAIVAEGLGIDIPHLQAHMRTGKITSLTETGIGEDNGRYRLTFFSEHRRFRLVADQSGSIIQRSTLDYGKQPLPRSAHKPGG